MPRKMKKFEDVPKMPSRQDLPGAEQSPKKRKESRGQKAERFQAETSSAMKEEMEEAALRERLGAMNEEQAFTAHEAAESMLKEEKKKQFLKMTGKSDFENARAALEPAKRRERVSREVAQEKVINDLLKEDERKSVKETISKMADAIDAEPKPEKVDTMALVSELQDIESKRMMEEEVLGYVEKPKKRAKKQETVSMNPRQEMVKELVDLENENQKQEIARKEMEELDKEWAERIKRDIEETEAKTSELLKQPSAKAESMQKAREVSREALEKYQKEVQSKQERAEAGKRIQANVSAERASAETDPARKRSLAKLKKLEAEHAATGNRLRDLTGMEPEDAYEKLVLNGGFMTRIRRGLAKLANVPTYDLLDSWIESGKKLEEVDREVMGVKPDLMQSLSAKGKRQRIDVEEAAQQATDREFIAENPEVAAIDQDYKSGVVRNAEGGVIQDEKEIRAKRPMSRVPSRKVSMGTGSISDAMSRAEPVRLYQPEAESPSMPKDVKEEESVTLEFQKERAADINTVRKEYPRAAELWNSIAARMQGMEQDQLDALQEVFGTRDLATAYVLDRAFYDMDGDQEAKARIAEADKIMGIEEVSPKKARPKLVKKAA
ncbi:hypothetical protein IPH19_02485 [Candidatus Uhrbacteria bacterium]|nr:MAG: hypothetical protein IPH19_02485 [Candidatus Uhrbacteria bacterium]